MKSLISTEGYILTFICLADMLSTLILVSIGIAIEQNPLMAACLNYGPAYFVLVKLLSFVPFVALTEWYRRHNRAFAQCATRAAICLYLATYVVFTFQANLT